MQLYPLDASGNDIAGLYISTIPTIKSNGTTAFVITITEREQGALQNLDALRYTLEGTAPDGGALRPDQYVQFNKIALTISGGIKTNL